jgi:serine/threonine-protein kinase
MAKEIGEGLSAAHAGIVHRTKPGNVMVMPEGRAVLMDFGLAKMTGSTKLTRTGATVGTASYMSPEQARGEKVDHRTDIWSLGTVLYEMTAGKLPFAGDYEHAVVYRILNEEPEPITSLRADVPIELERIQTKHYRR